MKEALASSPDVTQNIIADIIHRYQAYKPKPETQADSRVLDVIKSDTASFQAIGNYLHTECPALSEDDSKILIVGSGAGGLTEHLTSRFSKANFINLDISFQTLTYLRNSSSEATQQLTCADANMLPFSDDSIDTVIAHGVFRYISQPIKAIKEINRVLNTSGMAYAFEGKDIHTMGDSISQMINSEPKQIFSFIPMRFRDISMPRLTLFYALLENYQKDNDIAQILNETKAKHPHLKLEEALFKIAGRSIDDIYGLQWSKPIPTPQEIISICLPLTPIGVEL